MFTQFNVFGRRIEHENLWCHICKVQLVQRKQEEEQNQEQHCWFCNCVLERISEQSNDDPTQFEVYRQSQSNDVPFRRPVPSLASMFSIMFLSIEDIDESLSGGATEEQIASLRQEIVQNDQSQCYICQEDLKVGETKMEMQCHHGFHSNCLKTWLDINNSCPVCRAKIN